ncbi:MAG: PD-(D/E)XK nuclease family protein [Pseudomonadota bacterium]
MLDFNKSSMLRSKAVKEIASAIDDGLQRAQAESKPRSYLGASSIGAPCERKTQYNYMGVPKEEGFSAKTLRIFARGHLGEDMMADWLRQAGYDLRTEKPDGRQFGFASANGKFKGHCDGIIHAGPGLETPCIWENKCVGSKSWKAMDSKGVKDSKPEYYAQVQLYMSYLDLTAAPALFTALNMDDMQIYIELIKFDRKAAQAASDLAVSIIQDTEAGAMRPRVSKDPEFWLCRFCEYRGRCHA